MNLLDKLIDAKSRVFESNNVEPFQISLTSEALMLIKSQVPEMLCEDHRVKETKILGFKVVINETIPGDGFLWDYRGL